MDKSVTNLVRGMTDTRLATLPVLLVALFASGVYIFLAIADEVSENEIAGVDNYLLLLFRNPADPSDPIGPSWMAETVAEITALGGYPVIVVLVAAVVGFLLVSRKYGPALFVLLSISSGAAVSHLLKLFYERPRPDVVDHLVTIHTASFPSGHATLSTLVYLTLAALLMRLVTEFRVRVYVMAVAILLSLAAGISRIYLGVHWPSDVAAGWALGAAWASLSWLAISALRRYRRTTATGTIDEDDKQYSTD
ncbi:phosphatase PAP2 family protein [Aquamicrobium sp. LC103]|uniref:phosphatase PAP2 family protein n=1 Tax=Aquamicrobium sp. LC103 TaxID=1120658 RepID=UPI00063E9E2E|nr:phosphatase PAP2 family protein [Aquamicrobium sp. LC103]TKT77379.1 phosphatase PAP2 family protein [Aquamicrobium sp. LC103]